MTSAPVPPLSVLALLTEPVLAALPSVSLLVPVPSTTRHGRGQRSIQRDGVAAGAANEALEVGDGGGICAVGEGQGVGAGAEIDGAVGDGGGEGDGIGAGAADQCAGVADGAGVGGVCQGQRVAAGAEIDRQAVVSAVVSVMASLPVPPVMVSVLATVAVLVPFAEGQRVAAGAEIDAGVGDRAGEYNGVAARTGSERIDRTKSGRITGVAEIDY